MPNIMLATRASSSGLDVNGACNNGFAARASELARVSRFVMPAWCVNTRWATMSLDNAR